MGRSLFPREHGAYVQLAAPLVVAIGATTASIAFAVGAILAFFASEPMRVVLGQRGKRADVAAGRRWLAVLVPLAIAAGSIAFVLASNDARAIGAIALVPATIAIVLAWRKLAHSLAGEIVVAIALAGAAAPVAVAAGTPWQTAVAIWAGWAVGYTCTVVAVHRVIARHRKPATRHDAIAIAVVAVATIASIALPLALPLAAISLAVVIAPPKATHLRTIGFVFLGASVAAIAIAQFVHPL